MPEMENLRESFTVVEGRDGTVAGYEMDYECQDSNSEINASEMNDFVGDLPNVARNSLFDDALPTNNDFED